MKNLEASERIGAHIEAAMRRALSSMTGQECLVSGEADVPEDPIVWQQSFSFDPDRPVFWLIAGRELWTAAGQLTLAAVGIESVSDEDCRSTWQEIAGQTIGGMAAAFTGDLQREITAGKGEEVLAVPEEISWKVFSVRQKDSVWHFRAGWLAALGALYEQVSDSEPDKGGSQGKESTPAGNTFSKTFDLLLDVALPVNVSFGRTSLQIREVLKLNTGSIVELNRLVVEPVDVIVNDCVIARGEVVVVDGNYGVRITQLASREDRLRFGISQTSARVAVSAGGGI